MSAKKVADDLENAGYRPFHAPRGSWALEAEAKLVARHGHGHGPWIES